MQPSKGRNAIVDRGRITTTTQLVADFVNERFTKVGPFPHPTQMSVMPVVAMKGQRLRGVGTCFAISTHGLVMTARHVLEDALELDDNGEKKEPDQWIGVLYAAEPEPDSRNIPDLIGGLLPANNIFYSESHDIAVMHLNLPKNKTTGETIRVPQLKLGIEVPQQGEICVGLGYHAMSWSQMTEGNHTYEILQSYSASQGIVGCVHHARRDSVNLHFPCFEIDCRFDGGMSGGPVIDAKNGNVVGIICSSFGNMDGKGHVSYASLAGPSLLLVLNIKSRNERVEKKFLYDFVDGGTVVTDGNFTVIKDVNTGQERELEINFNGIRVSNKYKID